MTSIQWNLDHLPIPRYYPLGVYPRLPCPDALFDSRCPACVVCQAHPGYVHDVMVNRSIKRECKAKVIAFKGRLYGRQ